MNNEGNGWIWAGFPNGPARHNPSTLGLPKIFGILHLIKLNFQLPSKFEHTLQNHELRITLLVFGREFLLFLCTVWCSSLILTAEVKSYLFFGDRWQIQKFLVYLKKSLKFSNILVSKFLCNHNFFLNFLQFLLVLEPRKIYGQIFSKTPKNSFCLYFKKIFSS